MKVFVDWIGCRLNQSEIEKIANQLQQNGHEIIDNPDHADLVVINTCAVTSEAASDSRSKIRRSQRSGIKQLILTGCWATLERDTAQEMIGSGRIFVNDEKDHLAATVLGLSPGRSHLHEEIRIPLPGNQRRTRAFIKVQDGCDHYCTFCVTRIARGKSRSVPADIVLQDIQAAIRGGSQEVVLSGVQLGSWGRDLEPTAQLSDLIRRILNRTDAIRVRLSSIEPWDLEDDLVELWSDARMCSHLHLPLQSGCDDTLHRMARKLNSQEFEMVVDKALNAAPNMAITTDVIVGFPGETNDEFAQSCAFVEKIGFSGGHVFTYSPRPLTAAMKLPGQILPAERKRRSQIMREIFSRKESVFLQNNNGIVATVLWEESVFSAEQGAWLLQGLTGNNIRVVTCAKRDLWNRMSDVRIYSVAGNKVVGEIL